MVRWCPPSPPSVSGFPRVCAHTRAGAHATVAYDTRGSSSSERNSEKQKYKEQKYKYILEARLGEHARVLHHGAEPQSLREPAACYTASLPRPASHKYKCTWGVAGGGWGARRATRQQCCCAHAPLSHHAFKGRDVCCRLGPTRSNRHRGTGPGSSRAACLPPACQKQVGRSMAHV